MYRLLDRGGSGNHRLESTVGSLAQRVNTAFRGAERIGPFADERRGVLTARAGGQNDRGIQLLQAGRRAPAAGIAPVNRVV